MASKGMDEEIYEFCKGHYYSEGGLWQPFENYPEEDVKEYVEEDVKSLKEFMREHEKKVYLINCGGKFDFRNAEHAGEYDKIKKEAKRRGTVYTLEEFQEKCNDEEISLVNSFILID